MSKPVKKRRTQLRVVRPLHLSISLHQKIAKAAGMANTSVTEFIRQGAEKLADETIANAA